MDELNICALVRRLEDDFTTGTTHKSEFVDESLYADIQKIEAYINSKHTSGETDSQGREKPFANICVGARNIWYRATDIDRKNAKIKAKKASDEMLSYLATAHIQDWMNRENFGVFLNVWGLNSATYNYAVTKWVDQGDKLVPTNVPWTRIICDSIDFDNNPKIEILELTESQLRKNKNYDQKKVKKLCEAVETRKTMDGTETDTKSGYIRLYEVHGEFSLATLKASQGKPFKESDQEEYVQQMHVVSFMRGKTNGEYDEFTLYSGREKDPYYLTYLIPSTDGSISLTGAVKNLFESQWMVNHSMKAVKDQIDMASRIIFSTTDPNFVGKNALFAVDIGDILVRAPNTDFTAINNTAHDVVSTMNQASTWRQIGQEINGISDAMMGDVKAGSAWRQTEALLQESHDLFDLMQQNKKLHMENFLRKFIIPFVKKKMDTTKEIAVTLADYGIDKVEARFIKNFSIETSNEILKNKVLNNETPSPEEQQMMISQLQTDAKAGLSENGNTRFIKPSDIPEATWKDVLKDVEWEVEVDIPGENSETQEAMTTLNTIITMLGDPNRAAFFETPRGKFILNKALMLTNVVSPIELSEFSSLPSQVSPNPANMNPNLTRMQ